jgi:hypothetical protein
MKTTDLFLYEAIPGDEAEKKEFGNDVFKYSAKLGILPEWLMVAMYFESKLNSKARNPNSSATGLIQFMEATAKGLGTSTEKLYFMPQITQLSYVYKYLNRYAGKMKSLGDVYLAIFYPAAVGKSDDYILPLSENSVNLNKVLDKNKDHKLTKKEITEVIYSYFEFLKKKFKYIGASIGVITLFIIGASILKMIQ